MKKAELIEELLSSIKAKAETLTVKQLKALMVRNEVKTWKV